MTPEELADLQREEARIAERFAALEAERDALRAERDNAYTALTDVMPGRPATVKAAAEKAAKMIRDHDAERARVTAGWRTSYNKVTRQAVRLRYAWLSARRGRRSARLLNRELIRIADQTKASLGDALRHRDQAENRSALYREQVRDLKAERDRHLEHLRQAHPRHFTPNVLGQRLCGCDGQWPCREHIRLTDDQTFALAAIDAWQDGTTAPHDVLTAIRDRLSGHTTDRMAQARATALEQLAERYPAAFEHLHADARARATRKATP